MAASEELRIEVTTSGAGAAAADLDKVAASTDKVGHSARDATPHVKDLGDTSGDTSSALSYFAQAASAVGLDGLAGGLDAATVALDAAEGATILFRTAMESETVAKIASSLATAAATVYFYAYVVAGAVAEAATIIWTAATYALGAAFRFLTGPIGIIITVVALLAAGIVYLYNNNETFRGIVQGVWAAVRSAISAVVDWFRATVIPAFQALVSWPGWGTIAGIASRAFAGVKAAIDPVIGVIQTLIGYVQTAIGWISRISFPSLPSWLGGGGDSFTVSYQGASVPGGPPVAGGTFGPWSAPTVPTGASAAARDGVRAGPGGPGGGTVVQVMVPPTANPVETGRQIVAMLRQYEANAGSSWRVA